jgi:hypothetical protein
MASLEYIDFNPWHDLVVDGQLAWQPDKLAHGISHLPQIFWDSGEGWAEANHWALEKVTNHRVHLDTAEGLMKHLHAFACYLEKHNVGFKRSLTRFSTDLAIPTRRVVGVRVEDGLLPLSDVHMTELLKFTVDQETTEFHLMLAMGFSRVHGSAR